MTVSQHHVSRKGSLVSGALTRESVRFSCVGVFCTILDIGLFNLFVFGLNVDPSPSKVASTSISIVISFLLNSRWTFGAADRIRSARWQFAVYAAINLAAAGLSVICLRLAAWHHVTGILQINASAFAVVLIVGAIARFLLYRHWVFATAQ
jgi:putative flippase GtrA